MKGFREKCKKPPFLGIMGQIGQFWTVFGQNGRNGIYFSKKSLEHFFTLTSPKLQSFRNKHALRRSLDFRSFFLQRNCQNTYLKHQNIQFWGPLKGRQDSKKWPKSFLSNKNMFFRQNQGKQIFDPNLGFWVIFSPTNFLLIPSFQNMYRLFAEIRMELA